MNAKKRNKGPTFVAKSGIVGVPIYTIMRGHKSEHYAVCYYGGGKRQRRYFVDFGSGFPEPLRQPQEPSAHVPVQG